MTRPGTRTILLSLLVTERKPRNARLQKLCLEGFRKKTMHSRNNVVDFGDIYFVPALMQVHEAGLPPQANERPRTLAVRAAQKRPAVIVSHLHLRANADVRNRPPEVPIPAK